jgi:hypothetical protein
MYLFYVNCLIIELFNFGRGPFLLLIEMCNYSVIFHRVAIIVFSINNVGTYVLYCLAITDGIFFEYT